MGAATQAASAANPQTRYYGHEATHDEHGVIAPWYHGLNGQCDLRVRIAAETLKRYPWTTTQDAVAAYPHYLFSSLWEIAPDGTITPKNPGDWMNGDLGQRATSVLNGLVDYYRYTGDPAAIAHVTYMADFLLDHGLTPADHPWPGLFISVPVKGKPYGRSDPRGMIQLDLCGSVGQGLLRAYQLTGNTRWREAAEHWGDLLAERCNLDPQADPWPRYADPQAAPWKDNKQTGGVTMILALLDDLLRLGYTGRDGRVVAARDAGRRYLQEKLLPAWAVDETWGRYFWDWANPTQNCLTTPDAARYLLDHPAAFPQWRYDARNMLTLFLHHSSVAPDSRGDVYSGAWAYPESSSCCGRSLWYSPLLVAPVLAQYGVQADSSWCRELAYRQLVLQTYDVHETGVTEDNIDGGVIVNGQWFNIAHPLPLRWVLAAIAWLPEELGASRENHLVRASAVVNSVVYGPGRIAYATFDAPDETVDVLRLAFAPQAVTADGQPLAERPDLAGNGYLVKRLPNGDAVVSIRHDGARCIAVRGEDPQQVLDQDALATEGPWKTEADAAAYGGSLQVAETAGASVTARFEGNQVRVVGRVDARGGRADVELDGVPQLVPIDCWNQEPRQQQVLYYKNGLAPGPHTLRIVARGEKNPYAQGTRVYLDAVQYSAAGGAYHFPTGTGPRDTQRMLFGTLGREDYRDTQGQSWRPATEFVVRLVSLKDAVAECWWTKPVAEPIGGTSDPELYRYGVHAQDFWVNVTVGPGTYYARLKLAATRGRDQSSRGFAIRINGRTVVPNLDVAATAGSANRAVDLVFPGLTPRHGIIEVRLTGTRRMADDQVVQDEAYLQALEVGPGDGGSGATPVSAPVPKLSGNLLVNPGFEQTAGGVVGQTGHTARATGWTYEFLGPQTSYVWQEQDYAKHPEWGLPEIRTGQGAIRTHTDAAGHTRIFQDVEVAANTAYAASAWVRAADLRGKGFGQQAGDSAGLAIWELDEAGQVLRRQDAVEVKAAAPYQQLTQRFTTGPATAQVRFLLDSVLNCTYTEGHVTYDDCSLRADPK